MELLNEVLEKHYKQIKIDIEKLLAPGDTIVFDSDRGGEYIVIKSPNDEEIDSAEFVDKFINLFE